MEVDMPLQDYGVLAGRVVGTRREGSADTPHYQIHLVDGAGTEYRAAINVLSQQSPSELLYLVNDDFRHPLTDALPAPASGWTEMPPQPGRANLDFIRGNLFDRAEMRTLPPDVTGPDNDLADLLDHYVQRAANDARAEAYVYGQRFGPEPTTRDKVFGFLPGNGVHDVHMNQGNSGRFRKDDGVWQDGGMLLHFPDESRWVGIFLAFQSQAWHTDDVTGHALDGDGQPPGRGDERVRVVGHGEPGGPGAGGRGRHADQRVTGPRRPHRLAPGRPCEAHQSPPRRRGGPRRHHGHHPCRRRPAGQRRRHDHRPGSGGTQGARRRPHRGGRPPRRLDGGLLMRPVHGGEDCQAPCPSVWWSSPLAWCVTATA